MVLLISDHATYVTCNLDFDVIKSKYQIARK